MVTRQELKTGLPLAHFLFLTNSDNSARNNSRFQDTSSQQIHNTCHRKSHDSLDLWGTPPLSRQPLVVPGPKEHSGKSQKEDPYGRALELLRPALLPLHFMKAQMGKEELWKRGGGSGPRCPMAEGARVEMS